MTFKFRHVFPLTAFFISRGKRDLSMWVLLGVHFLFKGRVLALPSPAVYDLYPSKNQTEKTTHHH